MKEHALPQRQEQNATRDIEAQSTSRERNHTGQMESPVLLDQLFEDGSGIQDGPGSDWDFSIIPAHTHIRQEKETLPETPDIVTRPAENETESISGPTGRVEETVESSPGNTPVVDKWESTVEHTVDSSREYHGPRETTGPELLVEDSVTRLDRGQMKKSEFLERLQVEVTETVAAALVGTGRTTEDCPYLSHWFDFYMHQDSKHIERAIHKYAPESLGASRAAAYIASITQRARQAAQIWVMTGKITGVPEGVPLDNSNGMSAANGQVLFKARQGGVRGTHDPQTIQQELGAGRPLDMGIRSRMEPVFNMDFSHVRTHTDEKASILSTRYNARAFTVGEHIAFGSGEYLPGTLIGDSLIAHELAHVAQQRGASLNGAPAGGYDNTGHTALEADADWVAAGIMTSLWNGFGDKQQRQTAGSAPRLRSGLQLQRCAATQRPTATTPPDRTLSILAMPQTPPPELLLPGAPVDAGPLHLPFGQYQEYIGWNTLNRNGFIVQEMDITHHAVDCDTGTPIAFRPEPHYYEAWEVDGRGRSTPGLGGVNDMWVKSPFPNTEGNWSYRGRVYWVNELDPNAHFARGNVTEAGSLLSTTEPPNNLGPSLLLRRAGGSWDCTGTHTPA